MLPLRGRAIRLSPGEGCDMTSDKENTMWLAAPVTNAMLAVLLLAGVPFLAYVIFHKWRHKRRLADIARRAGLQGSGTGYVLISTATALLVVCMLLAWHPPMAPFVQQGSPQQPFAGLGMGLPAIVMALLYGVVQTGFVEELVFRGLIAGSLARRLPLVWANLLQAAIFLLPHLLILKTMPQLWMLLPLIFLLALVMGWVRIKSGSIIGSWLIHAVLNVTMCLMVAVRTVV
jgi:membrane protease YdiL (CAAX protease family)